jgi:hypothetical protein
MERRVGHDEGAGQNGRVLWAVENDGGVVRCYERSAVIRADAGRCGAGAARWGRACRRRRRGGGATAARAVSDWPWTAEGRRPAPSFERGAAPARGLRGADIESVGSGRPRPQTTRRGRLRARATTRSARRWSRRGGVGRSPAGPPPFARTRRDDAGSSTAVCVLEGHVRFRPGRSRERTRGRPACPSARSEGRDSRDVGRTRVRRRHGQRWALAPQPCTYPQPTLQETHVPNPLARRTRGANVTDLEVIVLRTSSMQDQSPSRWVLRRVRGS